jgi:hypothetical protein
LKEKDMGRCERCQAAAATKRVTYHQNIGLFVARLRRTVDAELCRGCSTQVFLKMTGVTLVFGGWGMISMIVAPLMILNNVVQYVSVMVRPWPGGPVERGAARVERRASAPEETGPIALEPERGYVHPNLRGVRPAELEAEGEVTPSRKRVVEAATQEKRGKLTKEEALAALRSCHSDIRMRLKGGETAAEIAAFIAPRTGVPEKVVRQYVERMAERG